MDLPCCNQRMDVTQVKDRGIIMVGESGIFTPDDVAFVQKVGGLCVQPGAIAFANCI